MALHLEDIRRRFPFLAESLAGHPIVYLDSAATCQMPDLVLNAMDAYYKTSHGNPHRGMHALATHATDAYEGARDAVRSFLNAAHSDEIIFTKSTTESINLVARSAGSMLKKGDAVALSILEHHSNIIPWLQLKEEKKIDVRWIEMTDDGQLDMHSYEKILKDKKVKLVAVTGLSNVLGTMPDIATMTRMAHDAGALILIDAAQLIGHAPVDVRAIDCDFLAFSGHKLYGPTGIGVLYGKREILNKMPPFLGGGMMIREVTRDGFTTADLPAKFEAGTAPVAEAVGLRAAIEWLSTLNWNDRIAHEQSLLRLARVELSHIPSLRILGSDQFTVNRKQSDNSPLTTVHSIGCISFAIDGVHPHDLTDILGSHGICLRAGHHCAQPLHDALGITASARLSVALYNTETDIRALQPAIADAITMLRT